MKNTELIQFVISIGSNIDNKHTIIDNVISRLDTIYTRIKTSAIYTTAALNGKDAAYCNCVAIYSVPRLTAEDIVVTLKQIEKDFGRNAELKLQGKVPVDLDLVIYNGVILRQKDFNYDYFQIGWNEIHQHLNSPI